MNTNNLIKGDDLMLFIGNKSVACATSHTLSLSQNVNEIACKDLNGWSTGVAGTKSWECTTENLMCKISSSSKAVGYNNILNAYLNGTLVDIIFGIKSNDSTTSSDNNTIFTPSDSPDNVPMLQGKAIITSLQITATSGDNATLSATFKGITPITTK